MKTSIEHEDGARPDLSAARLDVQHAIGLLTRRVLPALDEGDASRVLDLLTLAVGLLEVARDRARDVLEHSQRVAQPHPSPSPGLTYTPPEAA